MKDFDVVQLKDGRTATILEHKEDMFLVEVDSKTFEVITIRTEDVEKVIYSA